MNITVIIPVFNEGRYISQCVSSVLSQTIKAGEIIAVDDGSTDNAVAILRAIPEVTLIEQNHEGAGAARNKAAAAAKGDILILIDGDMYIDGNMFEKLTDPIEKGIVVGTNWNDEFVANPLNIWSQCWSIAHNLPYDRRSAVDIGPSSTTFRAIRRDVFLKAGGHYAERANGEDQIADKVGQMSLVVRGAACHHYNPADFLDVLRNAMWFGKGQIHTYKGFKTVVFLLKYSIFRSIPAGIYKAVKYRKAFFIIFKIIFDAAVTAGFIYASITKDNKK